MIQKISSQATLGGSATAVAFGLSPGEWQAIGVMGGIVIGIVGLIVNLAFQYLRWRKELARDSARESGK